MTHTTSELVWVDGTLEYPLRAIPKPIPLHRDNKAAHYLVHYNPVIHEKTKHLKVDCQYIRNHVEDGFISTVCIRSADQIANIMTKSLYSKQHHTHIHTQTHTHAHAHTYI